MLTIICFFQGTMQHTVVSPQVGGTIV